MLDKIKQSEVPVLISFTICPFVQRSAILLEQKGQPYWRINIDLSNKPDWFLQLSPTGKVPLLVVNDDHGHSTVLFESAVINEYLDERYGPPLLQGPPLGKAHSRAWISFSENLIMQQYQMLLSQSRQELTSKARDFARELLKLKPQNGAPFFNGHSFSLVDAAIAPVFTRLKWLPEVMQEVDNAATAEADIDSAALYDWMHSLINTKAVQNSVEPSFDQAFTDYFSARKSAAFA